MQKTLIAAALALAGALAATASATAMPVGPSAAEKSPFVQDVRDGCGRGFRLNSWGRCVPERRVEPRYYDDRYGGPRYRCGRGYRPNPVGRCVPDRGPPRYDAPRYDPPRYDGPRYRDDNGYRRNDYDPGEY
ncbi:hypothetical protein LMIY3S_00984 [Labrys miyagiensis]